MVFKSITDLIGDDVVGARPGSPPYLGSTSSSACSSPGLCGGCTSGFLLAPSFFTSGQQVDMMRTVKQQSSPNHRARCEQQELELQRSTEKTQEAMTLAEETIKSLTTQVESLRKRCKLQELELQRSIKTTQEAVALAAEEAAKVKAAKETIKSLTAQLEGAAKRLPPGNSNDVGDERIEQYERGVYVALVALQDGTKDIKRVRFSRKIFKEKQAETWWSENRERVYKHYNVRRPKSA